MGWWGKGVLGLPLPFFRERERWWLEGMVYIKILAVACFVVSWSKLNVDANFKLNQSTKTLMSYTACCTL
jgi:hypothetical protein